jgi:hypothetical protein
MVRYAARCYSGVSAMPKRCNNQIVLVVPVCLRRLFGIEDDCSLITTGAKASLPPETDRLFWDVTRGIMLAQNAKKAIASTRQSHDMTQLLAIGLDVAGAMQLRQTALQGNITEMVRATRASFVLQTI